MLLKLDWSAMRSLESNKPLPKKKRSPEKPALVIGKSEVTEQATPIARPQAMAIPRPVTIPSGLIAAIPSSKSAVNIAPR